MSYLCWPACVVRRTSVLLDLIWYEAARQLVGSPWFGPILAQATFDSALNSFIGFLAKILLLIGVAVVALGGWLISQGKNSDGVLAIIGGFIIAAAIPIVRLLAQMTGTSF